MDLFFNQARAAVPLQTNSINPLNTEPVASLPQFISETFPLLIAIIAGLAVLAIAYWGVRHMLSKVAGIEEYSSKRIWGALLGLLLALSAYLILNTINPKILESLNNFISS